MNRKRTLITTLAFVVGLAFVAAMFYAAPSKPNQTANQEQETALNTSEANPKTDNTAPNSSKTHTAAPATTTSPTTPTDKNKNPSQTAQSTKQKPINSAAIKTALAPNSQPSAAKTDNKQNNIKVEPIKGLHVIKQNPKSDYVTLGSKDKTSDYAMEVRLVDWGAGIDKVTLAHYSSTVKSSDRYTVLRPVTANRPGEPNNPYLSYPFAARYIKINKSKPIDLQAVKWLAGETKKTKTNQSVTYTLVVADGNDKPVLRIYRKYTVTKGKGDKKSDGSYNITLRQKFANLSGKPLKIVWGQNSFGDIPRDKTAYLGDRRTFVTGYLTPEGTYSHRVTTTDGFTKRSTIVGNVVDAQKKGKPLENAGNLWPNSSVTKGSDLVWLGMVNRYFAVTAHPLVNSNAKQATDITPLQAQFPKIGISVMPSGSQAPKVDNQDRASVVTLSSKVVTILPKATGSLDMGLYVGPRKSDVFSRWPYSLMSFGDMVRYQIEFSWITFQWLANLLLGILKFFHVIFGDWGVAIILLVVLVRGLLHPLTKKAQMGMMKMGKAMQSMQPEMEKLKKQYKDDKQTLNKEMMKLYKEKGVNPANMLGCLPMLLQMPIWIALYAMLYFAIELRHQPAFYGVFQWISSGQWMFLADLSTADHFINFGGQGFTLPLVIIHPTFNAINILPILMAVVFYFQQKFMTPPAATDQAKQQQKMMKFLVLLFPIMLYSLPSGLNLYILASTAAGVVDSYIVRKQIKEQEAAGTLFKKKERKKGGLMDRIQTRIEQTRKEIEQKQSGGKANAGGGGGGGGGRAGRRAGGKRNDKKQSKTTYKSRRKK